ncbi:Asp/Glu racemase [Candidatus Endobugula sertula]|uniref:Asp/Glu racemase n=1 Tax=Candidatus Endobugula sertula TaxID=62101 RepID=A0A1D2QU26_9GAMM|nr:Asp/Glu racemase [Candidatus Endobugula sertula]
MTEPTKLTTIRYQQPLEHLAPAGRIGVISLATDFNIEADLQQMYPRDVEFFTSRVKSVHPLTIKNLRTMAPNISAAADSILPGTDLDAIIYACTSGSIAIGIEKIKQLIHKTRPNNLVTNPVVAALLAFKLFKAKRLSILTPYTKTVNRDVANFFSSKGYQVINIFGFGFENDTAMTSIRPQDIKMAAIENCSPNADLLFISCTALRASVVLDEIEEYLSIPVVSSNQLLVWHSLKFANYPSPIYGFGSLLRDKL